MLPRELRKKCPTKDVAIEINLSVLQLKVFLWIKKIVFFVFANNVFDPYCEHWSGVWKHHLVIDLICQDEPDRI